MPCLYRVCFSILAIGIFLFSTGMAESPGVPPSGSALNAQLQQANRLYVEGDYEQAYDIVRPLADAYPDFVAVQSLYAYILLARRQYDDAYAAARHLATGKTASPQTKKLAGDIRQQVKRAKREARAARPYQLYTGIKVGNAVNPRGTPIHETLEYQWENLGPDVLTIVNFFNIPRLAAAPNAVSSAQDKERNEVFRDFILGGSYRLKPAALNDVQFNFNGNLFIREFDTLDDDNDGHGDSDVRLTNLQTDMLLPDDNRLYQLSVGQTHLALRDKKFNTSNMVMLSVKSALKSGTKTSAENAKDKRFWLPDFVEARLITRKSRHHEHPSIANNKTRSSRTHGLSVLSTYQGQGGRQSLQFALNGLKFSQRDNSGNYSEYSVQTDFTRQFTHFSMVSGLARLIRHYQQRPAIGDANALWGLHRRRDHVWLLSMKLQHDVLAFNLDGVSVGLEMNWRRQRSNMALYDVDRGELGLVLTKNL